MRFGNIELKWLGHSSFLIKTESKTIYIDPYNIIGREKADIILITHPHYDHCSVADINRVAKDGTVIVVPAACQSKITKLDKKVEMQIIEPGQTIDLGFKVGAVPAYNLSKPQHPKSEGWLGYVIKIKNLIIYHAGDTDLIPEMKKLTGYGKAGNEFIALLPVGGTFTMDAEQASEAAASIQPSLAIPMHFASIIGTEEDAIRFVKLCKEKGIKAEVLNKE